MTTAADLFQQAPGLAAALTQAADLVRAQGADDYSPDWSRRVGRSRRQIQKKIGEAIDEALVEELLAGVSAAAAADIRSAGGKGGAFLGAPTEDEHLMPDTLMKVALCRRLRVAHPGRVAGAGASHCQHKHRTGNHAGNCCGKDLDRQGHHAEVCEAGGGVVRRHDRLRDWLAKWIADVTGRPARTEQV